MLATAHQIYSTVIRLTIIYNIIIWHMSPNTGIERVAYQSYKNKLIKKLVKI